MKCPKCHTEQNNKTECESCGIIFEKYFKAREEKTTIQEQQAQSGQSPAADIPATTGKPVLPFLYFLAGVAVAGLAVFYSLKPTGDMDTAEIDADRQQTTAQQSHPDPAPVRTTSQPARNRDSTRAVSRALQATVFIKTPWGVGSGFFVDDQCHIVTNRHVVKFDRTKLANLERQLADLKENIDLEQKNIDSLEEMLNSGRKIPNRRYYEKGLQFKAQRVAEAGKEYAKIEETVDKIKNNIAWSNITVILADGSNHSVSTIYDSFNNDLALLEIFCDNRSPYLQTTSSMNLAQGQQVYTVGNPAGLQHTVTSGIFSGYREYDGKRYLQTDAPINPGNSGGPLIDESGNVIGVNSMILKETQGIGFAIPIETVLKDFAVTLNRGR